MRFSGIMLPCKLCEFMRKNIMESGAREWV